ncbi:MAG: IS4 family transposase, partial [Bacteroidetes bacterium]|nr:IS4 family transposase [Bacteroidota bacterium]
MASSMAAVLMAWDRGCPLYVRFEDAQACMATDFTRRRRVGKTYNGLVKALERQGPSVLPVLKADLRRQARGRLEQMPRVSKWLLMAVDGSKEELPRTKDHERVFGIADNGAIPQALVTTIVEVHTGLPWDWRIDRGRASEKDHLIQMAPDLPGNALLLGDGNFVGFAVWSKLHRAGKQFLIRVGGNVHLIERLWPETETRTERDIVYVWPKNRQRKVPPLMLRLIKVGSGPKAVYLLTNVLDRQRLSKRAAGQIYRRRWGAELFYRAFKRTLGYAKLQSKASRRARMELEWGLIAMLIATMLGINAASRRHICPGRLSPAQLLRTLRASLLRGASQTTRRAQTNLDRASAS